jgi:small subunit ribosomal protein S5
MSILDEWEPKTRLGREVAEGRITNIEEIFQRGLVIREYEIVDFLLPDLEDQLLQIKLVQKMSRAGRKRRFKATVAVGNKAGYIGIGEAKLREVGPAIRKAILLAKMNIAPVRRGCGSWECNCGGTHSIPFKTSGGTGSTTIELIPAPRGLGIAAGKVAKTVLELAGIQDIWSQSSGSTSTTSNYAYATFEALKNTYTVLPPTEWR